MSRQFSWLGSSPLCAFPEIFSSDIMQSCSPHSGGTAPALPEPLMHQRLLPASLLSLATPAPPYAILRNVRLTYVIILCLKVIIKIFSRKTYHLHTNIHALRPHMPHQKSAGKAALNIRYDIFLQNAVRAAVPPVSQNGVLARVLLAPPAVDGGESLIDRREVDALAAVLHVFLELALHALQRIVDGLDMAVQASRDLLV